MKKLKLRDALFKTKNPIQMNRVLYFDKSSSYASNGRIDTNDLLSPFFWNFTIPSTFACKV